MYVQNIGDGAISFVFASVIDGEENRRILNLYQSMKKSSLLKELFIHDVVPTYTSLTFYFDPCKITDREVERQLWSAIWTYSHEPTEQNLKGKTHIIPVCYKGPDLERVSLFTGLSVYEIIRRHCAPLYTIAMIGFRPHFPYLSGLDDSLQTDRLDVPRKRVPAGSVAIGGLQTGIYSQDSPGGWNIIGQTDPRRLTSLSPGDTLQFREEPTC